MKKLKFLGLVLLFAAVGLSFTACSDDDDDIELTLGQVVGTWDVIWAEQDGESLDVPSGYVYMTLNSDGTYLVTIPGHTYVGIYKVDGNTIVGTTIDPITEYFKFTSFDGTNASVSYSNSTGDKYNFRATKRQ